MYQGHLVVERINFPNSSSTTKPITHFLMSFYDTFPSKPFSGSGGISGFLWALHKPGLMFGWYYYLFKFVILPQPQWTLTAQMLHSDSV